MSLNPLELMKRLKLRLVKVLFTVEMKNVIQQEFSLEILMEMSPKIEKEIILKLKLKEMDLIFMLRFQRTLFPQMGETSAFT